MGIVAFPQNQYLIPQLAVHEVNPEVGVSCCLPPAALDWVPYLPVRFLKRYPVKDGVWWWQDILQLVPLTIPWNVVFNTQWFKY